MTNLANMCTDWEQSWPITLFWESILGIDYDSHGTIYVQKGISSWTKRLPFCCQHFQMHSWKEQSLTLNFTQVVLCLGEFEPWMTQFTHWIMIFGHSFIFYDIYLTIDLNDITVNWTTASFHYMCRHVELKKTWWRQDDFYLCNIYHNGMVIDYSF